MTKFKLSVFLFRRDLRLFDNTALINASSLSDKVLPLFILDSSQRNHEYFSSNAFEFMINSLEELKEELKKKGSDLIILEGSPIKVLEKLEKDVGFDALFFNKDYTPFSSMRDKAIEDFCLNRNIFCKSFHDYLLNPPGAVLNQDGEFYKVFTAFKREAMKKEVNKPNVINIRNFSNIDVKQVLLDSFLDKKNPDLFLRGGRKEGLYLLSETNKKKDYDNNRNFVFVDATSKLSAHLKFGTLSAREVYWFFRDNFFFGHSLISQIYWRDFFTHIAFFRPHVFGNSFKDKFNNIEWWGSDDNFNAWMRGETGYPLVDAGMRQLNMTGWMHGRARMLTGSFLVKNLGIDWRRGEKYFAQKLIDYDPCVNNGNWQWVASTGCDAQPFFRIFNPLIQQKKFDADCIYIKRYVKELENFSCDEIHNFLSTSLNGYPSPIVDFKDSSKRAKDEFSKL